MVFRNKIGKQSRQNKLTKLNVKQGFKVKAPIINEAADIIEVKVTDKVNAGECTLYIGEIVRAEAESEKYGWNLRKTKLLYHASDRAFMTNGKFILVKKS